MTDFVFTSPEGKQYRVSGPDGADPKEALQRLQRKLAGMPDLPAQKQDQPPSGFLPRLGYELKGIPAGIARGLAGTASASGGAAQIEMGQPVDVPDTEQGKKLIEQNVTGPLPKGGRFGEAAGEAIGSPTSYIGPGGPLKNLAISAVQSLAGEGAREATKGTKIEPYAAPVAATLAGFPFGRWRSQVGRTPAPLAEELHAAADRQYAAIRSMDLRLQPQPVARVADGVANDLNTRGFSATNVPETFAVVDRLRRLAKAPRGSFVGAQDFDNARQELLQAARNTQNLREGPAAWQAIEALDRYLSKIPAGDVLKGDGQIASRLFDAARGNWAAMKRLEMAGGKLELGRLNAETSHSGMNRDNAIRQAVKQLIRPNKYGKTLAEQHGFSPREIAAMREIARGTAASNTLRYIGNLLGGGGGVGQAVLALGGAGLGYETGHPELAGIGLLGIGARRLASAVTERQAQRLLEDIARRSPAGRSLPPMPTGSTNRAASAGSSALHALGFPSSYGGPQ